MALSQLQCLDDNNINLRINESKPGFFYSEEQRLALETLLEVGRDSFEEFMKSSSIRSFLSDLEVTRLTGSVEVFSPGSPDVSARLSGHCDEELGSLQYWPDRSDTSLPRLDVGWPDCAAYRGVTRAQVYTQPPLEGDTHIKEVVRKTIAQAQKVIAVVMDLFTDVDIFKDLLDASFKRKVGVYIILEATGVPHFLKMCERAAMHTGHLKNLRVRSIRGAEFFTRSSKKVCGSQSQKFMFIDGDKAVSGSYSFTWTASRLDRNIITMLTGQAVDAFDKLFRDLYVMSNGVNLNKINLSDEPKPEPTPQSASATLPTATMALKLINPKYALVSSTATAKSNQPTSERNTAKISSVKQMEKVPEAPQIHPGLSHLEKANMIEYLPVWPEPDPPSDVIGFINIRDYNKPLQAHLMRSELFESSQAIRFKNPVSMSEEPPPERASSNIRLESLSSLAHLADDQALTQPPISPEENSRNAKALSQRQEPVFLSSSDKMETDSPAGHEMEKQMGVLPTQGNEIHANSQSSTENITASIRGEENKDHQISVIPQLQPVKSFCSTLLQSPKAICTSTVDIETTSVKESCERAPEAARKTATQDKPRYKDTESDSNETKGVDLSCANKNSNLSSASEEYFECSDSLTVDSGFEGMIDGQPPGSGFSEQDRHLDIQSLSSITLQLQQLTFRTTSSEHESGRESLKETGEPQLQSGLHEQKDEEHRTGITIHPEPEDTDELLLIEADRLSEPVSKDDKQQMQETDSNSESKDGACEENPECVDRKDEELPLYESGHISNSIVNDTSGLKPNEVCDANKSNLAENKLLSNSVVQSQVTAPVIIVQTKIESQSIVFSDRMKELPLPKLKPELHSGINYTSSLTSAIEVNDVNQPRHQRKVPNLIAVFEKDPHAKNAHEKKGNLPVQLTNSEELIIEEDSDHDQAVKVKDNQSSVPQLKENAVDQTVNIKTKADPPEQKTLAGLKVAKQSVDVLSSVKKQTFSLEVFSKTKPVREHTCTYRELRDQPEAKPKLEGDKRKLRRTSPKPLRTPQEGKSVTKPHSTTHPASPTAPTLGGQNDQNGKQLGQNRGINTVPALPDKLLTRCTTSYRSSHSQLRRSRTEPSPVRHISLQKTLDRSRAIQSGQSSSKQHPSSTTEENPLSSETSRRRSRSLKEKIIGCPQSNQKTTQSIKEKEQEK